VLASGMHCRLTMQLSLHRLIWPAVSALVAAACGGAVTEQVVGPGTVRCQIAVSTPPQTVPAAASSVTLNLDAERDCAWTASGETAWLQVAPAAGQGSAALTVTVGANTDTRARSAAVVVNDTSVRINQDAMPCRFDLDPQNARINAEGGHTAIRVVTTDACEWRASSGAVWVRVLTERGTGTGSVEIDVSPNDGPGRSTAVSIAGLRVDVLQDSATGSPGGPAPTPPASCTFTIDPDRASFRSVGGSGSVRVVTEPGCPWSATPGAEWLSIPQASGTGPGVLGYVVGAHTSTVSDRSGTLTVAGRTHTVNQQACTVTLDPGSQSFGSPGGGGAIRVNTEPGCTWSASSGAGWISLARSNGAGPDTLQYQVAVYEVTGVDRSAAITVAGRTHDVRQAAYRAEEISVEGTLSNVSGSCPNFTFAVGGRMFMTDQRTRFDTECEKVRNGVRAFVRGIVLPDGRVLASQFDIDD
jgi:hypothetical protein